MGGAYRTKRDNKRPWKMVCIVSGFQSKTSALQFESAWQKYHITRHIPRDQRVALSRGMLSLEKHLANIRLIIKAPAFSAHPLKVHLFDEAVKKAWNANKYAIQLRDDILVIEDTGSSSEAIGGGKLGEMLTEMETTRRIYLNKSMSLKKAEAALDDGLLAICPYKNCDWTEDLLSAASRSFTKTDALIPKQWECPSCHRTVPWHLVAENSLMLVRVGTQNQTEMTASQNTDIERSNDSEDFEDSDKFSDFEDCKPGESPRNSQQPEQPEP